MVAAGGIGRARACVCVCAPPITALHLEPQSLIDSTTHTTIPQHVRPISQPAMSNGGSNGSSSSSPLVGEPLFTEVCSTDVLGFSFGGRSYQDQLNEAVAKTKGFCGVDVSLRTVAYNGKELPVVWVAHNFAFLGACVGAAVAQRSNSAAGWGETSIDRPIDRIGACLASH
jgi:hypothetical protein